MQNSSYVWILLRSELFLLFHAAAVFFIFRKELLYQSVFFKDYFTSLYDL
jgi:hypothetical protein